MSCDTSAAVPFSVSLPLSVSKPFLSLFLSIYLKNSFYNLLHFFVHDLDRDDGEEMDSA